MTPLFEVERMAQLGLLRKALAKGLVGLIPRQRIILLRMFVEGYTGQEAAFEWEITPQQANKVKNKALRNMRYRSRELRLKSFMEGL